MGRVAKYKKVKSFDPYSKKNRGNIALDEVGVWGLGDVGRKVKKRSLRSQQLRKRANKKTDADAEGFDLPPQDEEDDFDLSDILGSVKRQKKPAKDDVRGTSSVGATLAAAAKASAKSAPKNVGDCLPTSEKEERRISRMLKLDQANVDRANDKARMEELYKRRPGESKRQYDIRTKEETRSIMKRGKQDMHNPEKRQRKLEFLKQRKAKKKKGNNAKPDEESDDEDYLQRRNKSTQENGDAAFVTGERAVAAMKAKDEPVRFGEQAQQPPTFRHVPRGAPVKTKATAGKSKMTDSKIKAEQQSMEIMRRRVQLQYAQIKAKRKQEGDFHL